ncbi:MAG: cytochrome P460 family protein [Myxococcales bacterium]|nr:cytochrome P460 family protein [Myxococcales bacterium]MCB9749988.1 cytochrome P460 family protein [Myxococcales bacterium]
MAHAVARLLLRPSALAGVLLSLGACGDAAPEDGGRALLEQVQAADYRSWARAPGFDAIQPSVAPHGDFVEIFINDVLVDALASEDLAEWPVGSIIVKDGWDDADGTQRAVLAIMEKRELGWYFEEYTGELTADSTPKFSGQDPEPDVCVGCHESGADLVWAFGLP